MKIVPVDEKEYAMRNVWPKGTYPCTINRCEEGNSKKSGDPFFKCEAHVFAENGAFRTITTYVMAAGKAAWQLRSAAEAFGLLEQYQSGSIEAYDFEGKSGFAKVGIEEDDTGQYEPKNIIREFTHKAPKGSSGPSAPPPRSASEVLVDDSIPF